MKITIGIVNYRRAKVLWVDEYLYLLPNCIRSLVQAADRNCELLFVDFGDEWPLNEWVASLWPWSFRIIHEHLPFSIGRGRNRILSEFSGDCLVLLDADMIVPTDFIQTVAGQAANGYVVMPLYLRYSNPEHSSVSNGNGYGNLIIRSDVVSFLRQKFIGKPYPELSTWGGEDVYVAAAIKNSGKWPIKRELIPGFIHQWHPKAGDYYKKTI